MAQPPALWTVAGGAWATDLHEFRDLRVSSVCQNPLPEIRLSRARRVRSSPARQVGRWRQPHGHGRQPLGQHAGRSSPDPRAQHPPVHISHAAVASAAPEFALRETAMCVQHQQSRPHRPWLAAASEQRAPQSTTHTHMCTRPTPSLALLRLEVPKRNAPQDDAKTTLRRR